MAGSASMKTQNTYDTDVDGQIFSPKNSTKSDFKQQQSIGLNPPSSMSQDTDLGPGVAVANIASSSLAGSERISPSYVFA